MRLFTTLLISLCSSFTFAMDEGDLRFGVVGGNVSLLGTVGSGGQNSLGTGGIFAYQIANDIVFNLIYLKSDHTNIGLKHSDLSLGVDFYTGGDGTAAYYISGGAALLSNNFSAVPADDASAMGLYLGGGIDFQVRPQFLIGLKFKYNKAFEAKNAAGSPTVQDSVDVLAVAEFVLGKK